MKKILLAVSLLFALALPAKAEDPQFIIKSAHAFEHNGHWLIAEELLQDRREKLPKWNWLRLKRGERYVILKIRDEEYPVRLSFKDFKKHKAELKGILDRRKYEDAHPVWWAWQKHVEHWGPSYGLGMGVGLNAQQGAVR